VYEVCSRLFFSHRARLVVRTSCSYVILAILLSIKICYVFGVLLKEKKDSCLIRNIYIVNHHKFHCRLVLVSVSTYRRLHTPPE
jgi:hypothetical protein